MACICFFLPRGWWKYRLEPTKKVFLNGFFSSSIWNYKVTPPVHTFVLSTLPRISLTYSDRNGCRFTRCSWSMDRRYFSRNHWFKNLGFRPNLKPRRHHFSIGKMFFGADSSRIYSWFWRLEYHLRGENIFKFVLEPLENIIFISFHDGSTDSGQVYSFGFHGWSL